MHSISPSQGPLVKAPALLLFALRLAVVVPLLAPGAAAQSVPTEDEVLRRMREEGMTERSHAYRLAQELMDSIGPRLMGTPEQAAAVEWALAQYESFAIPARREQYGTWSGWRRGHTHAELIQPRRRDLDATLLAYSSGTDGAVEGDVVALPDLPDAAAYDRWLAEARGKFVLVSPPEPTCRPDENLVAHARPETVDRPARVGRQHRGGVGRALPASGRRPGGAPRRRGGCRRPQLCLVSGVGGEQDPERRHPPGPDA